MRSSRPATPIAAAERLAVGALAFGLVLWPAVRGGGHDVVARQELGLAVWWALALALGFGLLPRARPGREAGIAAAALAALAGLIVLGLLDGESAGAASAELARVVVYGGLLAAVWLAVGPRTWRSAALGLGLAAVAVPALAVVWRLGLFGDLGADPALVARRLSYPLGYWNALAAWAAIAFAIALAWSAHLRRPWPRSLALALLPVCGLALYLTYSRGGLASLAIAIAVVIGAAGNRVTAAVHAGVGVAATGAVVVVARGAGEIAEGSGGEGGWLVAAALVAAGAGCAAAAAVTRAARLDRRRLGPRGGAAAGIAAALTAIALAAGLLAVLATGENTVGVQGPELEAEAEPAARLARLDDGRGAIWESALRAFASDPLTGTGAGSFGLWWARDAETTAGLRDAHSLYLEALAELGLPGLAVLLVLFAALATGAIRARRTLTRSGDLAAAAGLLAGGAVYALHAGIDWLWEFPALVGLGLGGLAVLGAARARRLRPTRRLRPGRLALIALAIGAGAVQIPGIVSENRSRAAVASFRAGGEDRALELAADAERAQPWAAGPSALRAELLLAAGDLEQARARALEAIEREPTWWRHRALLARIELAAGNRRAAAAALADLARLRPAGEPSQGAKSLPTIARR